MANTNLPKIPPPPIRSIPVPELGQWLSTLYEWLGKASGESPLKSDNITGKLASLNIVPGARLNTINRATVDSVDDGTTASIRVYGAGGVGTEWTEEVDGQIVASYPAGRLPGFDHGATRDIYYDESGTFYAFDPDTQFSDSMRDRYHWVGRVKTVAVGGGGADATADAVISGGAVIAVSVTNQGSGYITAPTVAIAGDGANATARANISGGKVISVTITNVGSAYTAATVTFSGGRTGTTGGGGSTGTSGGSTAAKYNQAMVE